MKLDLTEKEYKLLLKHIVVTNNIIWLIWDEYEWFDELLENSDNLLKKLVLNCKDENIVNNGELTEQFIEQTLEIQDLYDELAVFDEIAYYLAKKAVWTESSEFEKLYNFYKSDLEKYWLKYVSYMLNHKL